MATTTTPPQEEKVTRRPEPKYELFTTCPQEWFIMVVRGEDLHRIIHSVDGWYVDKDFNFKEGARTYTPLRALFGRELVGIPGIQGIYTYKFAWNKFWRETIDGAETPEYTVQAHEEQLVYITPFEAQYPLQFGGIEVLSSKEDAANTQTKEEALIPITITITVRVRMIRPKIALMQNTDWFGQVLSPNIQKAVKDYMGDKYYDEVIRRARNGVSNDFADQFMRGEIPQLILNEAGVAIVSIGITDIKPNKQFEDALLAQAIAERAANAAVAKAEGEKKVKILQGQAEKEYAKLVGEGNAAKIIAEVEAEQKRIEQNILFATGGPGANAAMLEKWRLMAKSGLTTYVEGGSSATASILVGPNGRPIA